MLTLSECFFALLKRVPVGDDALEHFPKGVSGTRVSCKVNFFSVDERKCGGLELDEPEGHCASKDGDVSFPPFLLAIAQVIRQI